MAVINNGALTNGIRGKVGDVIFQMVNGRQVVRSMPASINDPHTPLQQLQRDAFAQAVSEWRQLSVEERDKWDFFAYLRSSRKAWQSQRRVDGCPKPENGVWFDGHNGAVMQKSRERDYLRRHDPELPPPIDLQDPPPFNKQNNLPPVSVQVLLSIGSLGSAWNPDMAVNYDGLWWLYKNLVTPTEDSKARVWVQPPYPVHRQRLTMDDPAFPDIWAAVPGVTAHDGYMWAWKYQAGAATIRIVEPDDDVGPYVVTLPYVWKFQHDMLDAHYLPTKGSAVRRFYIPDSLGEGLWSVWPTIACLAGPP